MTNSHGAFDHYDAWAEFFDAAVAPILAGHLTAALYFFANGRPVSS